MDVSIRGAREHNLKNVSLDIPRNKFVVFTGLSGSGKSSLAFDTIYAEGQRRYLESLSAYARQFLEQLQKPEVDSIDGLSPAISIEQKQISKNPRSTVGTVTEVYDYLRLLYSRVGVPHHCGFPVKSQSVTQIVDQIKKIDTGTKFAILAPIIRGKKGEYKKELLELRSKGFVRARIDGKDYNLSDPIDIKKTHKHDISIYVDRLVMKSGLDLRLADAVEIAATLTRGLVELRYYDREEPTFYSTKAACLVCGFSFPEIEPRSFSFNSPHGACGDCNGLGNIETIDPSLVVPDPSLALAENAIAPWSSKTQNWKNRILEPLSIKYGFSLAAPFEKLSKKNQSIILHGSGKDKITFKVGKKSFKQTYLGVIPILEEGLADGTWDRDDLLPFLSRFVCEKCQGTRLKPEMLSVLVGEKNIHEFVTQSIEEALNSISSMKLDSSETLIATPIVKEIRARLEFLMNVGLRYLTLSRSAATLSGGEAQRIRLATQIGSNLVGVLYILDEPSIGLHQRDNDKLILTLENLRDLGNSVIVVEHDQETIERSDFVVDLGPGAGKRGGNIVYAGSPNNISKCKESLTGKYLTGEMCIPVPTRRPIDKETPHLLLSGASKHNLKNIDVSIPIGRFVCVTGVSGSGKSSLVIDTLLPLMRTGQLPKDGSLKSVQGMELFDKVIHVDQSPIGRTPRSNPATYTGLFTEIRSLFASLPESKMRGYSPGRFSFNVVGGRCESCSGDGTLRITMHFLPDVFVRCEMCRGRRYNRETMEVLYRGHSIADVLEMSIETAYQVFERVPSINHKLKTLLDVGMGYVHLGQNAVTLSGGEAQRIKLARELNKRATGKTLYILDEPTTGLHFNDVHKLIEILHRLVDHGNSVMVIEHNLDVIKQADLVMDLGPEGGTSGGELLFYGTPEELSHDPRSHTAQYLLPLLEPKLKTAKKSRNPKKSTGSPIRTNFDS